jgi:hypothetical protein
VVVPLQVTVTLSPVAGEQIAKAAEGANAIAETATPIFADALFRAVRKTIAPLQPYMHVSIL